MMQTALVLLAAIIVDRLFGEPKRWHPLKGFGLVANRLEKDFNKNSFLGKKINGFAITLIVVTLPPLFLSQFLKNGLLINPFLETLILAFTIGARSLEEHAGQVQTALNQSELDKARTYTSYLVSRDTAKMSERELSSATIESTLENGNDAVFAPLFWFLIGGAPLALLYRLTNTLDAMWGYKTKRYLQFGWAAARLDDLLNYIPARLTALTYALAGHFSPALSCWRTQGGRWKSPNAGPVMSAGAGAIRVELGGPARYQGKVQDRPALGCGPQPERKDIDRAIKLLQRAILIWLAGALVVAGGLSLA